MTTAKKTRGSAKPATRKAAPKKAGDELTPATKTAASGALVEKEIAESSVIEHPAVDANPREGVPAASNQIDFNNPRKSQEDAVKENLAAQSKK